jgi:hypothetical protein
MITTEQDKTGAWVTTCRRHGTVALVNSCALAIEAKYIHKHEHMVRWGRPLMRAAWASSGAQAAVVVFYLVTGRPSAALMVGVCAVVAAGVAYRVGRKVARS